MPKVFRDDFDRRAEANIMWSFRQRARTRHHSCPPDGADAAWLCLAQHYGLPTRLLDWTESALMALYFAVADPERDPVDGAVFVMNPFSLNQKEAGKAMLLGANSAQSLRLINKAFEQPRPEDDEDAVVAILTEEVDLRMMVQLSGMTVHGSPTPLDDPGDLVLKLLVPADRKAVIRTELHALGIRERTIFPDLGHLAADLRKQHALPRG